MPKRAPKVRVPGLQFATEGRLAQRLGQALVAAIDAGNLPPGARLPSTRVLADMLGLSRNTVARAYEELWAEGLLEGRVGSGTFVAKEVLRRKGLAEKFRRGGFPLQRVRFEDMDGNRLWLIRDSSG